MNKKKGFTLVEILAVVIILGIISVIVYPVLNKILKDNRKKAFEASLNAVVRAAELYKTDNNNTLGIIDYDDGTIDMSNLVKWKAGTLTDKADTDGQTKIYLNGFYDGEFCGNGFGDNLTVTEGKCVQTPDLCFVMKNNEIIDYSYEYSACPTNINIPSTVNGENVLYIGASVFEHSQVSSVIIPNSLLEIRDNAFYESALTSLDLTNATSLRIIGTHAFEDTSLNNVDFSNLTSLVEIHEDAFETSGLTGIVDLTKSTNLTEIGPYSFNENQISSVRLNGLTHLEVIATDAFENNNITGALDLTNMTGLVALDDDVFNGNNITSINLSGTNVLQSIGFYTFAHNAITNINVDATNIIESLGEYAFTDNVLQSFNLTSFPNMKNIGVGVVNDNQLLDNEAFIYNLVNGVADTSILISYGGANRSSIVIPNNIVTIGQNSMSHQNITGITIPSGVTTIGPYALSYNELASVNLPTSVINIANNAFDNNKITQGNAIINNPPKAITLDATAFNNNGPYKNISIDPTYVYVDTVSPVLTMVGDSTLTVQAGIPYVDSGATATDDIDGDITSKITTVSTINIDALGTYTITYSVSDYIGNTSTATRTVNVVDTTAPVIVLKGFNPTATMLNGTYTDAGATVNDNLDQNLIATATGTVDTATLGAYTITYTATDSHGNVATPVTRTVNVSEQIFYYYALTNRLPVYGIAGVTTYPPTGWTSIVNGNADDNYANVPLPFSVNMYGTAYTNVYPSSNTYITFGTGATNYSGLSASTPAYNKLFFGGADNSYQRVAYYSTEKYVRIRYEGSAATSGSAGYPTIVVEITIFNPAYVNNNATMIEMLVGNHSATSGIATIANTTGSLYTNYTLTASTSYIFLGDSNGNNFQVFSGAKATSVDY